MSAAAKFEASISALGSETMTEIGCVEQAALVIAALTPTVLPPGFSEGAAAAGDARGSEQQHNDDGRAAAATGGKEGQEEEEGEHAVNLGVALVLALLMAALMLGKKSKTIFYSTAF